MKVTVAKSVGFCSGVRRAVQGALKALEKHERIYCLGEIIHNSEVIRSLQERGLEVVKDIASIPDGSSFIIRSHGLEQELIRKAQEKNLTIYDFTCPKVKKIHDLVKELTGERSFIVIAGNPEHPEVKAIHSLARENSLIVSCAADLGKMAGAIFPLEESVSKTDSSKTCIPDRAAVVAQTTFNPQAFADIVREIALSCKRTLVCNTLCEETLRRQREAVELAGKVDYIIVVGGKNSSNTKTLYDIVKSRVPAVHIENSGELDTAMLGNVHRVGIISGASTPEEEVKKIFRTLQKTHESDN